MEDFVISRSTNTVTITQTISFLTDKKEQSAQEIFSFVNEFRFTTNLILVLSFNNQCYSPTHYKNFILVEIKNFCMEIRIYNILTLMDFYFLLNLYIKFLVFNEIIQLRNCPISIQFIFIYLFKLLLLCCPVLPNFLASACK